MALLFNLLMFFYLIKDYPFFLPHSWRWWNWASITFIFSILSPVLYTLLGPGDFAFLPAFQIFLITYPSMGGRNDFDWLFMGWGEKNLDLVRQLSCLIPLESYTRHRSLSSLMKLVVHLPLFIRYLEQLFRVDMLDNYYNVVFHSCLDSISIFIIVEMVACSVSYVSFSL